MRTPADVIGVVVFLLGLLVAFGGFILSVSTAGSILFCSGVIMMLGGWLISRSGKKPRL
jgi:hypothetical protein